MHQLQQSDSHLLAVSPLRVARLASTRAPAFSIVALTLWNGHPEEVGRVGRVLPEDFQEELYGLRVCQGFWGGLNGRHLFLSGGGACYYIFFF